MFSSLSVLLTFSLVVDESFEICSVVEADRLEISSYILWTHDGGVAVVCCMGQVRAGNFVGWVYIQAGFVDLRQAYECLDYHTLAI